MSAPSGVRLAPFTIRRARTTDVVAIQDLIAPLVADRVLLGKDLAVLYAAVPEFRVAEDEQGSIIGCGALHVIWEQLAEVRTLAVAPAWRGRHVGAALLERLGGGGPRARATHLFF